jgi:hypothetical protein
MKRLARTSICALAAAGGFLAASAAPALAGSYSLDLSAPSTAVVGQPVVVEASGVNPPPSEFWEVSWIDVATISTSVMAACPADEQSGLAVSSRSGGQLLTIAMRPNLDGAGNFYNTMGWVPYAPGQWLVCGYQDDGEGLTLARDSLLVNVQPAPAAPAAPSPPSGQPAATPPAAAAVPANVKRPRVTRSGRRLVCSPGSWSNANGYSYSWLVNGKRKARATGRKLRLTRALHGRKVQCSVTASNASGKASALSAPMRVR